jgi:hypothetical protein
MCQICWVLYFQDTYVAAVLLAAGLVTAGFLLSGAAILVFDAALAVGAVAVEDAPGRRERRLVLGGAALAGSLAGSFAAGGFDSAFSAVGFATVGLGFAATGLGFAAGAADVVLEVVGVLGAVFRRGLFTAATLDVEAFAVEIAVGFLSSGLAFAPGVPLGFALLSAGFAVAAVG